MAHTLESWITILFVIVPMILVCASDRLSTNKKILACLAILGLFLIWQISGAPGGTSYLQEVCPNCDQP